MAENRQAGNEPTRRTFLKTTAAAAGTALAAQAVLPQVHAAGSDLIKVGLIGCGGRGTGAAQDVLQAAKGVQLVAIGDAFSNRVKGCRQRLIEAGGGEEIKGLGNSVDLPEQRCFTGLTAYKDVINTPGVNYVILATPPGFRPLHIEAAVGAGKNIFAEKPVGVDGPGIRQVLAAYDESVKKGLHIAAGTQRRHQSGYLETMKRIHDGEIGDLVLVRGYWNGGGIWFHKRSSMTGLAEKPTDLAYQLYNWYHFCWICGDHIVEQHVHNLDVCNWAMNKHPVRAWGMGSRVGGHDARPDGPPNEVGNIFDNFSIEFEYEGGARMISQCRHIPGCWNSVSEAAHGTKGFSQIDEYRINGKRVATRDKSNPYVQEHTDLIASIRSGNKPLNELKNVAESTLTAILGRMAAYTGKEVTWQQALNSKEDLMDEAKLTWDTPIQTPPVPMPGRTKLI
jgi:predicted dehydrogenase